MSNEKYLNDMKVQYLPEKKLDDEQKNSNQSSDKQNDPIIKSGIIAHYLDSKIDTYNDKMNSLIEKK